MRHKVIVIPVIALMFSAFEAEPAHAAEVVHISKKKTLVIDVGTAKGFSKGVRVCIRRSRKAAAPIACGKIVRAKDSAAVVKIPETAVKDVKVGDVVVKRERIRRRRKEPELEEMQAGEESIPSASESSPEPKKDTSFDGEFFGFIGSELRYFADSPKRDEQRRAYPSLLVSPSYSTSNDQRDLFTLTTLFYRLDHIDRERTHFDIRDMEVILVGERSELRTGVRRVRWGRMESQQLVDVINQVDFLEDFGNTDNKLGQPMINFAWLPKWGSLDFYILPYFRPRQFPSKEGRPSMPIEIQADKPLYQATEEEKHVDWATRLVFRDDRFEMGLAWFSGTDREPDFVVLPNPDGEPYVRPRYDLMNQFSFDLQYVAEPVIIKGEFVNRITNPDNYHGATYGLETVAALLGTMDLNIFVEHMIDSRADKATTAFENDIFFGVRVAANDINSTVITTGSIVDLEDSTNFVVFDAERRIANLLKVELEARILGNISKNDPFYPFTRDSFVQLGLFYYF